MSFFKKNQSKPEVITESLPAEKEVKKEEAKEEKGYPFSFGRMDCDGFKDWIKSVTAKHGNEPIEAAHELLNQFYHPKNKALLVQNKELQNAILGALDSFGRRNGPIHVLLRKAVERHAIHPSLQVSAKFRALDIALKSLIIEVTMPSVDKEGEDAEKVALPPSFVRKPEAKNLYSVPTESFLRLPMAML